MKKNNDFWIEVLIILFFVLFACGLKFFFCVDGG